MWAKVLAALAFGLVAVMLALALAALGAAVSGAPDAWNNIGLDDVGKFALLQVSGVLQGLAFGLIFLNSAAAIVTSIWTALQDVQPWIDLGTSQQPLFMGENMTGEEWAQLLVGTAIWVVLPFLVGLWRVLRAEVK